MRVPSPALLLTLAGLASPLSAAPPEQSRFFEAKIRPVLVEHCERCHSAAAQAKNKLKGGLLLDGPAGLKAGGDSGPALDAEHPADSLLLQTLRYAGDIQMPPAGKLPAAVIADFEAWVKLGAPDPRGGDSIVKKQVGLSLQAGRQFWSYRPIADPAPPAVRDAAWPTNDIDRFILAALEAKGLRPAPDADRATLARRLYFDLTGLPPTPEQIAAFADDTSPGATERLVDTLLASPAFGERWGRHWLDVARYAESVTLRGLVFPDAWRYRDYVIDSFNRGVPFDRFVREQLAGDLLPAATPDDRRRQLVATTYLMLGNTNLEDQDKAQLRMDVVDEQLDVISKGILAQTVTCARCHDHKFDPIPTADYYALAGILRNADSLIDANVSAWTEVPLPVDAATDAAIRDGEARIALLQARLKALKSGPAAKGKLAVKDVPGVAVDDAQAKAVGAWTHSVHSGHFVGEGYRHDANADKGQKSLTFAPVLPADGLYEVRLAYAPGDSRSAAVPVTVFGAEGETLTKIDMRQTPPIDGRFVSLGTHRFEKAGQAFVIVSNEGTVGHVTADCVTFIPKTAVAKPAAPTTRAALEAELAALKSATPKRPKAMAPVEEKVIEDCRIHVRGGVHTLGPVVPRGFLRVVTNKPTPALPKNQSGRVQLADWLTAADNPLTARVYANRAWHWLFGAGIVRTLDNFGTTGEAPSHPELLDFLATRFVEDGWSVKKLVRRIVLSRTYRQASALPIAADPDNRLLAHANRKRLDAECLRDAMLVASGTLKLTRGGPTFAASIPSDYNQASDEPIRSVYLPAFRNSPPELIDAFDAADPSSVTGRRNTSTVAPQALVMLNHPFVAHQARHAAERLLAESGDADRLARAYHRALGRDPTAGERRVAERYLADRLPREAWAGVFHALIASADFRYLD